MVIPNRNRTHLNLLLSNSDVRPLSDVDKDDGNPFTSIDRTINDPHRNVRHVPVLIFMTTIANDLKEAHASRTS